MGSHGWPAHGPSRLQAGSATSGFPSTTVVRKGSTSSAAVAAPRVVNSRGTSATAFCRAWFGRVLPRALAPRLLPLLPGPLRVDVVVPPPLVQGDRVLHPHHHAHALVPDVEDFLLSQGAAFLPLRV